MAIEALLKKIHGPQVIVCCLEKLFSSIEKTLSAAVLDIHQSWLLD